MATPIFSPDSKRLSHEAQEGNDWLVVVDGKGVRKYDGIVEGSGIILDSPDRLHYLALKGNRVSLFEEAIE